MSTDMLRRLTNRRFIIIIIIMRPNPVYGARAEKPLQNADFAMRQTNICRLSCDIITITTVKLLIQAGSLIKKPCLQYKPGVHAVQTGSVGCPSGANLQH